MTRAYSKPTGLRRWFILILLAATLLSISSWTAAQESLSFQVIIDRAVARAEAQHARFADAWFESQVLLSMQSLDENAKVVQTDLTTYRQYPLYGALYEEVLTENGKALSVRERKDEEKNKMKFIREVEKRKGRGMHPQPEKKPGLRFGERLMRRYRFKMLRIETVDTHRCWVVSFEPKEGSLPVDEIMDHALNQSTGVLWIAQEDFGVVRLDFIMRKPFKYWAGLLAVIRNTEGRLDFIRVESGIWLPASFDLKLDLNVMMVKNIRRRLVKKWSEYKRAITPSG